MFLGLKQVSIIVEKLMFKCKRKQYIENLTIETP